jgi:hypothetical protein
MSDSSSFGVYLSREVLPSSLRYFEFFSPVLYNCFSSAVSVRTAGIFTGLGNLVSNLKGDICYMGVDLLLGCWIKRNHSTSAADENILFLNFLPL